MDHIYDVIILGAGPAGLSAGLYAGRSRLDTLIIEKGQAGGQIINTDEIENYPGQIVEGERRRFSCTQNVRTDRAVRSRTCP